MHPSSLLLDPKLLARLGKTRIRVDQRVDGTLSGIHRSPHHGASVEFTEHAEYSPGDELKNIDWQVYGRTDRYYVKRFEDETNMRAFFVLDCSGSMGYEGPRSTYSKLTYSARLTATLAYLLLRQRDAVGVVAARDNVVHHLPARASSRHVNRTLELLDDLSPTGKTDLARGLARVAEMGHKRGLVLVLSDMFTDLDRFFLNLAQLKAQRHRVMLLQILDPDELSLPFRRLTSFRSLESPARLLLEPRAIRGDYMSALATFLSQVASRCGDIGVEHHTFDTSQSIEEALETIVRALSRRRASSAGAQAPAAREQAHDDPGGPR